MSPAPRARSSAPGPEAAGARVQPHPDWSPGVTWRIEPLWPPAPAAPASPDELPPPPPPPVLEAPPSSLGVRPASGALLQSDTDSVVVPPAGRSRYEILRSPYVSA